MRKLTFYIALILMAACQQQPERNYRYVPLTDTTTLTDTGSYPALADSATIDSTIKATTEGINTRNVDPSSVVAFAHTLKGTPYKYGSTNPAQGWMPRSTPACRISSS